MIPRLVAIEFSPAAAAHVSYFTFLSNRRVQSEMGSVKIK